MSAAGRWLAAEIAEQPAVWRAVAGSPAVQTLRDALAAGPVLLLGSGSSFHVAQLVALTLRRQGAAAVALAAGDADDDGPPFLPATVIAYSQSGRSADILAACARFHGARLVAVTNDPAAPLAAHATAVVPLEAGSERAVPASKSVTAMIALSLLAAASDVPAAAAGLRAAADVVEGWLVRTAEVEIASLIEPAGAARAVVIAGSGTGVPAAREIALKLKEAAYVAAEGVSAGEFRHGGIALLDPACLLIVLGTAGAAGERLRTAAGIAGTPVAPAGSAGGWGPALPAPFDVLGWIVAGQALALALGRARGIDPDAPRGIGKVVG